MRSDGEKYRGDVNRAVEMASRRVAADREPDAWGSVCNGVVWQVSTRRSSLLDSGKDTVPLFRFARPWRCALCGDEIAEPTP